MQYPGITQTRPRDGILLLPTTSPWVPRTYVEATVSSVAILDFDGTSAATGDIFRHDERVLLCSELPIFRSLHYINRTVPSRIINCPLPAGSSSGVSAPRSPNTGCRPSRFPAAAGVHLGGIRRTHDPDPLAELRLSGPDYGWITESRTCGSPIVTHGGSSRLEGGYDRRRRSPRCRDPSTSARLRGAPAHSRSSVALRLSRRRTRTMMMPAWPSALQPYGPEG